jgi:hypothetical protein
MRQNPTQAVRSYRVYLRDGSDMIARVREIDAGSDEEARQLAARMLYEQTIYPIAEVWDRARLVWTARK